MTTTIESIKRYLGGEAADMLKMGRSTFMKKAAQLGMTKGRSKTCLFSDNDLKKIEKTIQRRHKFKSDTITKKTRRTPTKELKLINQKLDAIISELGIKV